MTLKDCFDICTYLAFVAFKLCRRGVQDTAWATEYEIQDVYVNDLLNVYIVYSL